MWEESRLNITFLCVQCCVRRRPEKLIIGKEDVTAARFALFGDPDKAGPGKLILAEWGEPSRSHADAKVAHALVDDHEFSMGWGMPVARFQSTCRSLRPPLSPTRRPLRGPARSEMGHMRALRRASLTHTGHEASHAGRVRLQVRLATRPAVVEWCAAFPPVAAWPF